MSGGKISPRQKMIGMMYLVLTALLALNISKEIINAFIVIEKGLANTNSNSEAKNEFIFKAFAKAKQNDEKKAKPLWEKANAAKKLSEDMITYLHGLRGEMIAALEGIDKKVADTMDLMRIQKPDDYDVSTHFMIGEDPSNVTGKAKELKAKLNKYQQDLIALLPKDAVVDLTMLNTKEAYSQDAEKNVSWEWYNFYHLPIVASAAQLKRIENDVRNAEGSVVNELFNQISASDFKFDKLQARVIAPSSYILAGEEYKAEVFVAASSSTQNPTVIIGCDWDSVAKKAVGPNMDSTTVKVDGGIGTYAVKTGSEGLQKWGGVIKVKKPDGTFESYPFKSEYMVARPAAAVSPDKMNVFYIGVDNPISVSAAGVAPENLVVNISGASMSGSRGKYIVRPNAGVTESNVSVGGRFGDKTTSMGSFKFRVKRVPDPVCYVGSIKGDGIMPKAEVANIRGIFAKMENFDFDLKFDVVSWVFSMNVNGVFVEEKASGPGVTGNISRLLASAKGGTKVLIEQVNVKGPDGTTRKIPGCQIKVR
ncbi:MAG: gliding motility-associated protein GldM [Bacteroidetes bacterium]|nr:MAG: gliding motility-associated protein GldM [Bacteroidota bacterium]